MGFQIYGFFLISCILQAVGFSSADGPSNSTAYALVSPSYNQMVNPAGHVNATTVYVGLPYVSVVQVREALLEMDVVCDIMLLWADKRLNFPKNINRSKIFLKDTEVKSIWSPNIRFRNAKKVSTNLKINQRNTAQLSNESEIWMWDRYIITSSCVFDFHNFPFDKQICAMELESKDETEDTLKLAYTADELIVYGARSSLPQYYVISAKKTACQESWNISIYQEIHSCLIIYFTLQRKLGYYILHVYIPSIFLVISSWTSFFLSVDAVPGRVALGLSSLVTLTSQFLSIQTSLPPVPYLKSLDVWILSCMFFIFLSLVEFSMAYSWQHGFFKQKIRKMSIAGRKFSIKTITISDPNDSDSNSNGVSRVNNGPDGINRSSKQKEKLMKRVHNIVDHYAKFVFPIAFAIFNACYWPSVLDF